MGRRNFYVWALEIFCNSLVYKNVYAVIFSIVRNRNFYDEICFVPRNKGTDWQCLENIDKENAFELRGEK
jgi:hypothetical protein